MIISQRQSQQRHTSRMNIFVMLMMLFVVSGHCSAAVAMAPGMAELSELQSASADHCGEHSPSVDDQSGSPHCWDEHCPSSVIGLQSQSVNQTKNDQADAQLLAAVDHVRPLARAGPCAVEPRTASAEFITPPLFYTLCVLRL
ncbi:MAG: hypothetical protein V7752_18105 [Halopseudomonas sp.]